MESKSEIQKFWRRLKQEITAGLRHGFFDFSITGETLRQGECSVTFKAGKSHRFRIPEIEFSSDPEQQGTSFEPNHQSDQHDPDVAAGNIHDDAGSRPLGQAIRQKNER